MVTARSDGGTNLAQAPEWETVRDEASQCRRCHLYCDATQTVFGEGPSNAALLLVGEQPGDREDIEGRPFVGPAGRILDCALDEAGIDRTRVYVTNAVKHFKFQQRGKRRLHSRPDAGEIEACRWWLDREREIIDPALSVALGATAARALLGKTVTISRLRGEVQISDIGKRVLVTVHPSYLLRIRDRTRAEAEYGRFVADLAQAKRLARRR